MKSPAYTFVAGTQIAWQQHSLNHFLPSFLSFPLVAYLSFSPSRKFSPRKVSWYVQMRAYSWNQSRSSCQRREESAPNHSGTYARGMLPDALTFHKSQSPLARFFFFLFPLPLLFVWGSCAWMLVFPPCRRWTEIQDSSCFESLWRKG